MSPRVTLLSIPSSSSSSVEPKRSLVSTTTWASPSLVRRSCSDLLLPCSDEPCNSMNPTAKVSTFFFISKGVFCSLTAFLLI
ncbi:hypothetical protein LINPERHAP2_LOCUS30397 [Linum perenne]